MGQTATGTILAAFGTALSESVVTLVVFGANADEKNIGAGAAPGGPLVLGLLFMPWLLQKALIVAGVNTLIVATAALFTMFGSGRIMAIRLVWVGTLYVVFALTLLFT